MFYNPGLHPQLAHGVGFKQLLVQLVDPGPALGAGRGHPEGVGRGVGEAEAARIRAEAHIDSVQSLRLPLPAHALQHIEDHLRAGGTVRVHQFQIGEGGGRAMVIDAQKVLGVVRQHAGGSHVRGDHGVILPRVLHGQPLHHPGKPGAHPGICQHMGIFSQAPQPQAKGRGAAQSVPVRPDMGQDHIVVVIPQDLGRVSSL